jgi:hypothetical protein
VIVAFGRCLRKTLNRLSQCLCGVLLFLPVENTFASDLSWPDPTVFQENWDALSR